MAKMKWSEFVRKAKSAPSQNKKAAGYSLVFLIILLVWWIINWL